MAVKDAIVTALLLTGVLVGAHDHSAFHRKHILLDCSGTCSSRGQVILGLFLHPVICS